MTARAYRCTCREHGSPCPGCAALWDEAEWERGARDNDPEPRYPGGGYEPNYHYPRDLAPIGWP